MIGLHLSVPIASWRRGHAREYLETEPLPPPSTLYGFLLSLVGETDRGAHVGARVTGGIFGRPPVSRVLRTTWRIKKANTPLGVGENARPDWQELVTGAEVVLFVSSEAEGAGGLEARLAKALADPGSVRRFGGLSLGESTHLVDSFRRLRDEDLARAPNLFVAHPSGDRSMSVWVDHVGNTGTRYAVGRIEPRTAAPSVEELPVISPGEV